MRAISLTIVVTAAGLAGCVPHWLVDEKALPETGDHRLLHALSRTDSKDLALGGGELPDLRPAVDRVRTVQSPDSVPRHVSVAECLALALENGRTGEFFDAAGTDRHTSVTGSGRALLPSDNSDSMRVFAFDPTILATETEQSLARFDPIWMNDFNWLHTNRLSQQRIVTAADELILKNQLESVGLSSTLLKPLATGGVAGLFFTDNYIFQPLLPSSQFVNPAYRPVAGVVFEQPLLRGAGVPINQILDTHPGGFRNPFPTSNRSPGIMVTRIGQAKSQLEFERRVHELVFRVEEAYWNLYGAYWELYARENGMRQRHRAWLTAKNKQAAGGIGEADMAMIEQQYYFFRTQRIEALGRGVGGRAGVLEAERRLRYVVGLPAEDGTRLVPDDSPDLLLLDADWNQARREATELRPELRQIHEDLKMAELALAKANDMLKPDLRLYSKYDINGLGTNVGNSFQNFVQDGRSEWELGMRMVMPIGFREGHAELSRARLQMAQRVALLRDQEDKLIFSLQRSYRDLVQFREEIQTRRSQQEAAARQLKARLLKWNAGGPESVDLILRAQRNWVDALREEQGAICNYRIALIDYERQKGTILQSRNIRIADGQLPNCARPRASLQIRDWLRRIPDPTVLLGPPVDSPPNVVADSMEMPRFDPAELLKEPPDAKMRHP